MEGRAKGERTIFKAIHSVNVDICLFRLLWEDEMSP